MSTSFINLFSHNIANRLTRTGGQCYKVGAGVLTGWSWTFRISPLLTRVIDQSKHFEFGLQLSKFWLFDFNVYFYICFKTLGTQLRGGDCGICSPVTVKFKTKVYYIILKVGRKKMIGITYIKMYRYVSNLFP